MSYEAVARRYARAIFELGAESGTTTALASEVSEFAATYESSTELQVALQNPLVPEVEREAALAEIADRVGASDTLKNALLLLLRRRRLPAISHIARQLGRLVDQQNGLVRATVTSAGPLSPDYLDRLRAALESALGKKVALSHTEDRTLIAGVVTSIGDRTIDGSIRARLSSFRDALLAN